ncbi:protein tyrosine phosphatase [Actinomadura sp. CNU-125]|uniref:tyrosine-protein phosphatase n=1 Tax=Actinomadura sp. CNU-125 TaxID=1904961 RepID=UPI0009662B20|nr:tyrosine-protein phosphatase [Actinomadura sp. CNU-125]OLT32305.1 protein tyrosine phosphatase [Actinomadura sp. CNU-125]
MSGDIRWIELDGAVNARDLGGLPTADGRTTRYGRVLRSDNLQDLSVADVRLLCDDYELKNIVDLRSSNEIRLEGPGPLNRVPSVTVHQLPLLPEGGHRTDVAADTTANTAADTAARALPAQERSIGHYLGYLRDRGDSVVAALRVMTRTDGSTLVHCAAGKDRTGVVCALALETAGVTREAIVADYARTAERLDAVLARLRGTSTYAKDLDGLPADAHRPDPTIMEKVLTRLEEESGGAVGWLTTHGWTDEDTEALQDRLLI